MTDDTSLLPSAKTTFYNDFDVLLTLQRQLFQIAAVRRVQRHTGLTHHFNF